MFFNIRYICVYIYILSGGYSNYVCITYINIHYIYSETQIHEKDINKFGKVPLLTTRWYKKYVWQKLRGANVAWRTTMPRYDMPANYGILTWAGPLAYPLFLQFTNTNVRPLHVSYSSFLFRGLLLLLHMTSYIPIGCYLKQNDFGLKMPTGLCL